MQWKQIRYRLEWVGVKALAIVIPQLPRETCAQLARIVGTVAYALDGKGRRVALANIEAALGDEYDDDERRRIARQSYQYFARTMLDLFWGPALLEPSGHQYAELTGAELIPRLKGKPCVMLVSHYAGFEWASLVCGMHGFPGNPITQAFKNPLLTEIFRELRELAGNKILTQEMSMLRMLRQLKKGTLVGLLIDLNLAPEQAATIIDTFGMKMCATYLHAILAERTGALLVPLTSYPRDDGTSRVELHEPLSIPEGATPHEVAQQAWNFFEELIRRHPERWMWSYKHWRYKPKGAEHAYPFYANESGKFEKLTKRLAEEREF